jgi:hypothetical protein
MVAGQGAECKAQPSSRQCEPVAQPGCVLAELQTCGAGKSLLTPHLLLL